MKAARSRSAATGLDGLGNQDMNAKIGDGASVRQSALSVELEAQRDMRTAHQQQCVGTSFAFSSGRSVCSVSKHPGTSSHKRLNAKYVTSLHGYGKEELLHVRFK